MPPRSKKSPRKKIAYKKGGRLRAHHKVKQAKKGCGFDFRTPIGRPSSRGCFGTGIKRRRGKGIADLFKKSVDFLNSAKGKEVLGKAAGFAKEHAPKVVKIAKDYRAKYGRPPK